jgi:hypothetical protein
VAWRLDNDVLFVGALRIAMQRIGIAYWRAAAALRSWGAAPLHRQESRVLAPCSSREALWLGAWLEGDGPPARVRLQDAKRGAEGVLDVAAYGQLTTLVDAAGRPGPVSRGPRPGGARRRDLALHVECRGEIEHIELALVSPALWSRLAGRTTAPERHEPPPLPPRLG